MEGQQRWNPLLSWDVVKGNKARVRVHRQVEKVKVKDPPQFPHHYQSVKSRVWKIYDTKAYSDVEIVVGEGTEATKFQAHKWILGVSSPVLATMIEQRWLEGRGDTDAEGKITLNFPKATPNAFELVLKYFYTDALDPKICNLKNCLEIYELAHMYKIPRLQATVAGIIASRHTNVHTAHQIWAEVRYIDENFAKKNWEIFVKGIVEAAAKGRYLEWNVETIKLILSENRLPVREVDLFRALLKWGRHDEYLQDDQNKEDEDLMTRHEEMVSLMKLIHFDEMSSKDFDNYVVTSKVFSSEDISKMMKDFEDTKDREFYLDEPINVRPCIIN